MKAIETIYNNYRFRSRLEARWAVFFDTLGVKYRYEYEGYALRKDSIYSKIWYLPDFWLPEYERFIEIKGQSPTNQETARAGFLALQEKKNVYIFWGDMWIPDETTKSAYRYFRPHVSILHPDYKRLYSAGRSMLSLFGKKEDGALQEDKSEEYDGEISIPITDRLGIDTLDVLCGGVHMYEDFYVTLKDGKLIVIDPKLEQRSNRAKAEYWMQITADHLGIDLVHAFDGREGWITSSTGYQDKWHAYCWQECDHCGRLAILPFLKSGEASCDPEWGNDEVIGCGHGTFRHDSSRLIAAYTAARQARFEHGEGR